MPRRPPDRPATPGSVTAETTADLRLVEEFLEQADRARAALLGVKRPRSPLREAITRKIVLSFSDGKVKSLPYYERVCATVGSRTAVQRQMRDLELLGLVFLRHIEGSRAVRVMPSERLIDWYNNTANDLRRLVRSRLP